MFLEILLLLFFSKKELSERSYKICEFVLDPISREYSNLLSKELEYVLRDDIFLLVDSNTSSIFRYQVFHKGLNIIRNLNYKLVFESFSPSKVQHFFIDKESLAYYDDLQNNGIEVIFYNRSLISNKYYNILIKAYKAIAHYDINNLTFFEFSIRTIQHKNFKEYKLSHQDIGTIHTTVYKTNCIMYNILLENFNSFLSNQNLINLPFYEISSKYIENLTNLFLDNKILKKRIEIYNLLPYVFTKDLSQKLQSEILITGGICFDKLTSFQKQYFDLQNYCKDGDRFLFTFKCLVKNRQIVLEQIT